MTEGDLFYKFFLGNFCLNDCCYKCKYKACNSSADIRIGDLWSKKYKSDDKGTSAVISLTKKGHKVIKDLNCSCTFIPESLGNVLDGQMTKSPTKPWVRDIILNKLKSKKSLVAITRSELSIYKILLIPMRFFRKLKRISSKKR